MPDILCLIRFLAIKDIVQDNLPEACLREAALNAVEKQIQISFNNVQKKGTQKNNNKLGISFIWNKYCRYLSNTFCQS